MRMTSFFGGTSFSLLMRLLVNDWYPPAPLGRTAEKNTISRGESGAIDGTSKWTTEAVELG
jgi:hypothetical protein